MPKSTAKRQSISWSKDNVFNVRTPTDWQPTDQSKRKPPFGVKAAEKAMKAPEGQAAYLEKIGCTSTYERNRQLIDFNCIPEPIYAAVSSTITETLATNLNSDFVGFVKAMGWGMYDDLAEDYDDFYKQAVVSVGKG
jgi:hypothetical protein